jgi:DNA invertase Pin-like site-specific DNA recombinase
VPTSGGPNFRPRIAKSVEGDRAASRSAQLAMLAIKPSDIRSLGDPLWDTSSAQWRLLSTLLAGIGEFERELTRERTGDGRMRTFCL